VSSLHSNNYRFTQFGANRDTYGAQNAGWKALLIRRPGTDGDGEAKEPGERLDKVQVIHGLEEVLDFVKMINTP
jgi:FMN phosphatase YigB (HAD superfamily)